jgi:hypothetical protein
MTAVPQRSVTDGRGGAERRADDNRGPDWAAAREEKEKRPEGAVGCYCAVRAAGLDRVEQRLVRKKI